MEKSLFLNFIGLENSTFTFKIWKTDYNFELFNKMNENLENPRVFRYRLPENGIYKDFLISFNDESNFSEYECPSTINRALTQRYLFQIIYKYLSEIPSNNLDLKFYISHDFIGVRINFIIKNYEEFGQEIISIQPYYLQIKEMMGLLVFFNFKKKKEIPYTKEVQKLSLNLDSNYRSNKDYYFEKYQKLVLFLKKILSLITTIKTNTDDTIQFRKSFENVHSDYLDSKIFVVGQDKDADSLYNDILNWGPYKKIEKVVNLLVIGEKKNNTATNILLKSLKMQSNNVTMDFKKFFRITNVNIFPFETELMLNDLNKIKESIIHFKNRFKDEIFIPIFVIEKKNESNLYIQIKSELLEQKIPTQVITTELLTNDINFKWAYSNICLQLFCKIGGIPWIIKPKNKNCLIYGIGQAHKFENNKIIKFFSYSVCTDSSGIYQEINILGKNSNKELYLKELRENIIKNIAKNIKSFSKVVIHIPFKVKQEEINEIKNAINQIENIQGSNVEFVVIRINQYQVHKKFFGFADTNSKVPYESTLIKLDDFKHIYLLWFEGLETSNSIIRKHIPGPTYIEFIYSNKDLNEQDRIGYLQDILNLSGANYRGFNSKSIPISTYYCSLVLDFYKEFGDKIDLENIKNPWFL